MEEVDRLILEAVDEGLSRLGHSVKHVTLYYAERKFGLPREEIPRNIEKFEEVLREMYDVAADHIALSIAEALMRKLGCEARVEVRSLSDAVKRAYEAWRRRRGGR